MFNKPQEQKTSGNNELKELLITEAGNDSDAGILEIAKKQLTSDLHQKKIARAIELLKAL